MNKNAKINVAIVGYGYWGPNLVRTFNEIDKAEVICCCDKKEEKLEIVRKRYPRINVTTEFKEILNNQNIEAVVIATPLSSHFTLAKQSLSSGKHVWLEKPMVENSIQAKELIALADKENKIVHVDHIFLYTQAVNAIKKMMDKKKLGKIYYFDSVRINLGLFQPDTNVIWDLAVHDISIMCYLLGKTPKSVSVFATSHFVKNLEDTAYLSFKFSNRMSAHISISWLSPVKIRRTLIAGSKKMILYDDLETSEKVKIYDCGVSVNKTYWPESSTSGYQYRTGDIYSPALENKEALKTSANHFINCIKNGNKSLTDGNEGLKIVKILEAATRSLKNKGKEEIIE